MAGSEMHVTGNRQDIYVPEIEFVPQLPDFTKPNVRHFGVGW